MKPGLLVLAAGLGSRYGSLKQVDSFGPAGEAIIEYSVYDAMQAGFGRVVFVIARNMEKDFADVFARRFPAGISVEYVIQELPAIPAPFHVPADRVKPWGTGHAVWVASKIMKEPFAVINGDDFYGTQSYKEVASFLRNVDPSSPEFCLAGYPLGNTLSKHGTVSRGVCEVDKNGFLAKITEHTKIGYGENNSIVNTFEDGSKKLLQAEQFVSMNLFGFTTRFFDDLTEYLIAFLEKSGKDLKAEFYLPFVVNELIHSGKARVKVLPTPESWFGVTYKEDKPVVMDMLRNLTQQGKYPVPLWSGWK